MTTTRFLSRAGYTAALLLLLHAALSVYWASGGMALLSLLSEGIREQADLRETWFIAIVWGVAVLKVAVAISAIAVVRGWSAPFPLWLYLTVVLGAGVGLTLYGASSILMGLAALTGVISGPDEQGRAFWGYLLLWAPWWLAIGLTCLVTGWTARRPIHRPGA